MGISCNRLRFGWLGFTVAAVLLMLRADPLWAQLPPNGEAGSSEVEVEAHRDDAIRGMPIDTGWVVLDGEYVASPYTISKQGRDILLNERRVMTLTQSAGNGRDGFRRGEGRADNRGEQPRRQRRGSAFGAARIEQQLISGGLVVIVTDAGAASIGRHGLPKFIEAIESSESIEEKVNTLSGLVDRPVHTAVWLSTIEYYRADTRLKQFVPAIQAENEERIREREARLADHGWFDWLMPMAAIAAVLLGVSVLLKAHRIGLKEPGNYRLWRHIDTSGLRSRVVLLLIALLVLLNGLDLTFTLIAQQTGQFAELSPIGDRLITKPMLLGLYKVAAVALGAGLLVYLRKRRAAEVAAWWMCAVYVLVLVRWVAVNTLIMA